MRKREKRERKKQDRGIVDFMMVTNHFFHALREWILEMAEIKKENLKKVLNNWEKKGN